SADHEQPQFRPRNPGVESLENRKWIFNIGAAPCGSGLGHAEVAARSGASSLHLDAGLGYAQQFSRLMLGENAGDVIVHYDHFVDFAVPLLGKHSYRRRAATHSHTLFLSAVDHRRPARLDDYGGASINREFHRLAVA